MITNPTAQAAVVPVYKPKSIIANAIIITINANVSPPSLVLKKAILLHCQHFLFPDSRLSYKAVITNNTAPIKIVAVL